MALVDQINIVGSHNLLLFQLLLLENNLTIDGLLILWNSDDILWFTNRFVGYLDQVWVLLSFVNLLSIIVLLV